VFKLSLSVDTRMVEATEALLAELGAVSTMLEDAGDHPLLEPLPGETPLWPETVVTGLFEGTTSPPGLVRRLAETLAVPEARIHQEPVPEQDWIRLGMEDFKPLRFGEQLWIVPSWHEPPEPGAVNILLDPGLAFGTGTHATTSMCLTWLDMHPPRGAHVLDYGCGSGVLAIAALALGAMAAWAVDIDPQALTATRENAARNGIPPERLKTGTPDQLPGQDQFDLVMANILAGPT
jgi:ribosomal protein L11 methyltransferase